MGLERKVKVSVAQWSVTLCNPMDCSPPRFSWNSPGQSPGVDSHSLLQGIFLTQGSNPGLLHCRQIRYHLSHLGSPTFVWWSWVLVVICAIFSCGMQTFSCGMWVPDQESNQGPLHWGCRVLTTGPPPFVEFSICWGSWNRFSVDIEEQL